MMAVIRVMKMPQSIGSERVEKVSKKWLVRTGKFHGLSELVAVVDAESVDAAKEAAFYWLREREILYSKDVVKLFSVEPFTTPTFFFMVEDANTN